MLGTAEWLAIRIGSIFRKAVRAIARIRLGILPTYRENVVTTREQAAK